MFKSSSPAVLIVDELNDFLMQKLEENNIGYAYRPDISKEGILALAPECSGIVIRSKMHLGMNIIHPKSNIEFVLRAGSGMDNLDVELLEENGISCYNCPEGNRDAVAEQTIGMLLSLKAKIVKGNRETGTMVWDREGNRGIELKGKTVGIIGFGNAGSMVAKKLSGFDCNVIAYDKYKSGFTSEWVREVSLSELYAESDVISFHVPLSVETENWIDDNFFNSLSKPIVLLNLSRGEIMNTNAVLSALTTGRILALGLDVLENEKMGSWNAEQKSQYSDLRAFNQVIITPHGGGWTTESYRRISEIAASKIISHFEKSIPLVKDENNISDNT
jgi:D-3-phosphoglycerate dehydrogenase / 2-oxoglutarate reductase